jgi:hypothetical protein
VVIEGWFVILDRYGDELIFIVYQVPHFSAVMSVGYVQSKFACGSSKSHREETEKH